MKILGMSNPDSRDRLRCLAKIDVHQTYLDRRVLMASVVTAPWTEDQVKSLEGWQSCGFVHPFTAEDGTVLIPTVDGWRKTRDGSVVQDWAHDFMADWSWKECFPTYQR